MEYNNYRKRLNTDFQECFTYKPGMVLNPGDESIYEEWKDQNEKYLIFNKFRETKRGYS